MKIYRNIFKNHHINRKGVTSIGYFDAFHLGHSKLLSELVKISKENKLNNFVLTYTKLPVKDKLNKRLLVTDDKILFFKKLGIKNLILSDFDDNFSSQNPEDFIKLLKKNFNINNYVISEDFSFGKNKSGHRNTLELSGCEINYIDPIYINNIKVSTSYIKKLITNGNIEKANQLLLRPFYIKGIVQKGKQLGRTLGFPTMNIKTPNIIYPSDGVYISMTHVNNKEYYSMTYVSYPIIESHLLGYNKFRYNMKIKVDFFKKIRDNRAFNNNLSLIKQLKIDLTEIKDFYSIRRLENDKRSGKKRYF